MASHKPNRVDRENKHTVSPWKPGRAAKRIDLQRPASPMLLNDNKALEAHLVELAHYLPPITASNLCRGGNVNWVWRIVFASPHDKQVFLEALARPPMERDANQCCSLILKSMDTCLSCNGTWRFSTDRVFHEMEALCSLAQAPLVPKEDEGAIRVPTLYYFSAEHKTILLEDVGEGSLNLKAWLSSNESRLALGGYQTCMQIGKSLGRYLCRLHSYTHPKLKRPNMAAREFVKMYIFDQLGQFIQPYMDRHCQSELAAALEASQATFRDLYCCTDTPGGKHCFIMGDLWPEALLFPSALAPRLVIIDWEFSGHGCPLVDLGSFLFWTWMLHRHASRTGCLRMATAYRCVGVHFWTEYTSQRTMGREDLVLVTRYLGVLLILEAATSTEWCLPLHHGPSVLAASTDRPCPCKADLVREGIAFLSDAQSHLSVLADYLSLPPSGCSC